MCSSDLDVLRVVCEMKAWRTAVLPPCLCPYSSLNANKSFLLLLLLLLTRLLTSFAAVLAACPQQTATATMQPTPQAKALRRSGERGAGATPILRVVLCACSAAGARAGSGAVLIKC